MSNEDFGRITRILNDGTEVELEFNIVNRVYPEGRTSYNTIAEIRGTDKADEVIMLGGHPIRGTRQQARLTTRSAARS